jgi:predicted RNase H-like nuclease (RuvC/YqgF family)
VITLLLILAADPTTWDTIIGTGGWAGALGIIAFIAKQGVDAWVAHRRDKREGIDAEQKEVLGEVGAAVGNASTVNALMLKSLENLAQENERLLARNSHLEDLNAQKDAKIDERDKTIEQLKANLEEWVSRGQQYVEQITNYQRLLREQEGEVD